MLYSHRIKYTRDSEAISKIGYKFLKVSRFPAPNTPPEVDKYAFLEVLRPRIQILYQLLGCFKISKLRNQELYIRHGAAPGVESLFLVGRFEDS